MKMFLINIGCVLAVLAISAATTYNPQRMRNRYTGPPQMLTLRSGTETWATYEASVDNFDESNDATFNIRYLYNLQYVSDDDVSPPIIIYCGGEWAITEGLLSDSQLSHMGSENGAALFYLEHRFYGESMPAKDFTTSSLQLLSHDQAMADIIGFINWLKANNDQYANSKVVLFGCSYSATLVMWTRLTYPDDITAVYASSGPMEPRADIHEFLERTSFIMKQLWADCAATIKEAVANLEQMYDINEQGSAVRKMLGICQPPTDHGVLDKAALFKEIATSFGNWLLTNLQELVNQCTALAKAPGANATQRFVHYRNASYYEPGYCHGDDFEWDVKGYADTTLAGGKDRAFQYQQCNGLGWFVTAHDASVQIFGESVPTDFYYQRCQSIYGERYGQAHLDKHSRKLIKKYGGKHMNITKAVFVYGNMDPWAPMGLDYDLNDEAKVYHTNNGHCWDMFSPSVNDDEEMATAKRETRAHIQTWLSE